MEDKQITEVREKLIKNIRFNRISKRRAENRKEVTELKYAIKRLLTSNYWSGDISKFMIETIFSNSADSIEMKFEECIRKLK